MKVVQINTVCGFGSTGRTSIELSKFLTENDSESIVAYGQYNCEYDETYKIGSKVEKLLHNLQSRIFGNQCYYSKYGTTKLVNFLKKYNPDIIHLRNLHGNYINIKVLFEYLQTVNTPIIWTLHDCWPFTGKCTHYSKVKCYKWQSNCHNCPQVRKYPPSYIFDQSNRMFNDKKKLFTSIRNMTIVTVSKWLENEVKYSFLSKYPIITIYNWIDTSKFYSINTDLSQKYDVNYEKFIILGVSGGWSRKSSKLNDFIYLSDHLDDKFEIVLVGNEKEKKCIPKKIKHIPYINDIKDLANIYSKANVFVHLSTEDTFGKVIVEALACGTPVIVYNSTACPEIAGINISYIVEPQDFDAIISAIYTIKKNGKEFYSSKCIQYVNENYSFNENATKYLNLYKSKIKENS